MALVLTIGGVDRTSVLRRPSIVVEQQAADFISICSLTLYDVDGDIAIAAEDAITVVDTATYFSGRVVDIRYSPLTANHRLIHLKCQDLNWQLVETVVDTEEVYDGVAHGGITADSAIIDDLFDTYLNTVTSDDFALNQTIQDPLTITIEPTTLRSALSQICTQTGGYFYIDFSNNLHYFSTESSGVAWHLSDVPDDVTSFGYLLKNPAPAMASAATTRLDGVFVVGAGVSGWRGTHAVGDRQAIVRDNRITTTAGRDLRGDAILAKHGSAKVTYTISTYKVGLRAGMDVRFICALYGVDATFDVRRMVVKWDKAGTVFFTLTLGAVVNPSLISERIWTDTLDDALRPVTAPRLPTSSRGWSHNLVFSATDSDTVAWAAAGVITLADGTTYTIDAGNTGNMAAITYIYLDIDTSITVLQTTTTNATAVGSGKILIAVAENVADATKDAVYQVFGGEGQGVLVSQEHIAALSVTTNEIAANTILAGNIAAGAIKTDELDALAVTAAKIAANTITADKIEMGIGDGLYNAADGLLLLGPHCEINTTEWWSLRKQLATLSGAFHQEAGRWQGTRGLVVEEATTNLILNPSLEVDTTGWTAPAATISRDTTYSAFGDASLKVITDNAGTDEGPRDTVTVETAASTEYTFSVYLRGSGTVKLWFWDAGAGSQLGSVITLTPIWTRHEFTATFGVGGARLLGVGTDIQQSITFYCDGFQLEQQDYTTSYCDGSLGTGYAWTGAAHGSTSTRAVTAVNLDAHAGLISSNDTVSFRIVVQMPYDADATWPAVDTMLFDMRAGADNNNRIAFFYAQATDTVGTYINGGYRGASGVQTFNAGDWLDLTLTLDFTADDYNIYINGLLADNDTTVLTSPAGLTLFSLGSEVGGVSKHWNATIVEFAVFDRVLTAIEVAGMYALQRPMIDMGALDKPGIYILDGAFKIASSTSGARIEITADEIAGYDSAGTKQFYLQSSDGKALAGAGAVILDETGLYTVGSGATGDTRRVRFVYDDSGTERAMGKVFGDWAGGAASNTTWLQAWRVAGDPWPASKIILAALDTVAGDDTRITIHSANGLVEIGGDTLNLAGDIVSAGGGFEFAAATGDNIILIPDNVAEGLILEDGGGYEFLCIITSDGPAETIHVNRGEEDIDTIISADSITNALVVLGSAGTVGVGMVPTADGILSVGLATENFEIMDAGSAGATQQDWVKVEIGGVVGYLHVFAAV